MVVGLTDQISGSTAPQAMWRSARGDAAAHPTARPRLRITHPPENSQDSPVMKSMFYCVIALCLSVFAVAEACSEQQIFVATTGSDTNPGTLEKPFATLQRARQAARKAAGAEACDGLHPGGDLLSARDLDPYRRGFRHEGRSGRRIRRIRMSRR